MERLRAHLRTLSVDEQRAYAMRCGTTIGYLRKALSLDLRLRAHVCVALERESAGAVTRRDLRPDDWQDIWPELAESEPKPTPAPAHQARVAINSEAMEAAHG